MDQLIEAFKIFKKYASSKYITSCEHDVLYVQVDPSTVSDEDIERLEELGFSADFEDLQNFHSYKYGSC